MGHSREGAGDIPRIPLQWEHPEGSLGHHRDTPWLEWGLGHPGDTRDSREGGGTPWGGFWGHWGDPTQEWGWGPSWQSRDGRRVAGD